MMTTVRGSLPRLLRGAVEFKVTAQAWRVTTLTDLFPAGKKMARFLRRRADLHRRREEEIKQLYPSASYSTTVNVFFEMVPSGLISFYK